jgi:ABC-type sugar transport system ATPase subunit
MVRLGIRCNNIKVAEERIGENSFQLPVFAVARQADSSLITFELKDVFLQAKTEEWVNYALSDRVWLEFDQDHILFFEKTIELSKG